MPRPALRSRVASSPKAIFSTPKKNPHSSTQHLRAHDARQINPVGNSLAFDQRDVFDWYEKNQYKDDAGDIFSAEWECRLTDWSNEFNQDINNVHDRVSRLEQHPENLELGLFFLAHPVAAFSFWHLLQACYELDRRICGTSTRERNELNKWQKMRPFEYLQSPHIMATWGENLVSFSSEVKRSTNNFERETVASRLYAMDEGVQILEEALSILENVFEGKRAKMRCSYWMLNLIREGVNVRCRAIENQIAVHQPGI